MAGEVIGTQLKTGNVLYYASGVATQDRSSINSQPAVMLDHRSKVSEITEGMMNNM